MSEETWDVEEALKALVEDSGPQDGMEDAGDIGLDPKSGTARWFTLQLNSQYSVRATVSYDVIGRYDGEDGERTEIMYADHDKFIAKRDERVAALVPCTHTPQLFSDECENCEAERVKAESSLWYSVLEITNVELRVNGEWEIVGDTEYSEHDNVNGLFSLGDAIQEMRKKCQSASVDWFTWSELIHDASSWIGAKERVK